VITERPLDVQLEAASLSDEVITLNCTATSDPSTPVVYRWYIDDEPVEKRFRDDAHISDTGTLLITPPPRDNPRRAASLLAGTYRCHATNGYSHADVTAVLRAPPGGW